MAERSDSNSDGCEIIAEAGVNHNGRMSVAKEMIDEAADAGADVVKFQTFTPEEVVTTDTKTASYQERSGEDNQFEMLRGKSFSKNEHEQLNDYCESAGVEFMSTPYDQQSVALLEAVGVERYKIASADIVNKPLLETVVETGKPIVLSTGMATLGEIERAVTYLRTSGCEELTLLHCISMYPTSPENANLRYMDTLANAFDASVGFSDHTLGTDVPIMAATLGASVIEKHFTLDRSMSGPDHEASLEPEELDRMVETVHRVPDALGDGTSARPTGERENIHSMRRSLHARRDLEAGKRLERTDLRTVRPFDGIDPWEIDEVTGRTLTTDLPKDQPLEWEHLD